MADRSNAVWEWIKQYKDIDKLYFNFGIAENGSCNIIPMPSDAVIKEDICGNKTRYYDFAVSVFKDFDTIPYSFGNIAAFAEVADFMDWICEQNRKRSFPVFDGCMVKEVKTIENNPSPGEQGAGLAKYFFRVRITYIETEEF